MPRLPAVAVEVDAGEEVVEEAELVFWVLVSVLVELLWLLEVLFDVVKAFEVLLLVVDLVPLTRAARVADEVLNDVDESLELVVLLACIEVDGRVEVKEDVDPDCRFSGVPTVR